MKDILVIGHKNPDTDSVVSAHCYAALKNRINPDNNYTPARCGSMTAQTKFIFDSVKVKAPNFVKDVYAKVGDVMTKMPKSIQAESPLSVSFQMMEDFKIKNTPVTDKEGKLLGMVGTPELTHFYLSGTNSQMPEYLIRPENLNEVLEGEFIKKGTLEEFPARVLVGAMSLESFQSRLTKQDTSKIALVVGRRENLIRIAVDKKIPLLVLTGLEEGEDVGIDFTGYEGWVFVSRHDSAESMRRVFLSVPAKFIMASDPKSFHIEDDLEEANAMLSKEESGALPVVDHDGILKGILTKSDILKKKAPNLILMDHNEPAQAVEGAETAEILEILDHHRLGVFNTKNPVFYYAKPVGATCTLVVQQYQMNGVELSDEIAKLLLSGILTDTVILKSPTTTDEDRLAVSQLSTQLAIDPQEWGIKIFSSTDSMSSRTATDIINADFKAFDEGVYKVGIGQVEVVTLEELPSKEAELYAELEVVKQEKGLNWAMLLVTDIIKEDSLLLCTEFGPGEAVISYKKVENQKFHLPGVLSRKKQLLPEILRSLEEISA